MKAAYAVISFAIVLVLVLTSCTAERLPQNQIHSYTEIKDTPGEALVVVVVDNTNRIKPIPGPHDDEYTDTEDPKPVVPDVDKPGLWARIRTYINEVLPVMPTPATVFRHGVKLVIPIGFAYAGYYMLKRGKK